MNKLLKGLITLGLIPRFISSIVFLLISILILFVIGGTEYHIVAKKYIFTKAKIVDIKYKDGDYIHIYEFKTEDGTTIRGEGFPESDKNAHQIGAIEEIAYNPKKPTQFDIGEKIDIYPLTIMGVFFLIISIISIKEIIVIYKQASNYIDDNSN